MGCEQRLNDMSAALAMQGNLEHVLPAFNTEDVGSAFQQVLHSPLGALLAMTQLREKFSTQESAA
jgi:hypothetical protein